MKNYIYWASILLGVIIVSGCATLVPEHTLYLGEVAHIATHDEVLNGLQLGPDKIPPPTRYLERCQSESNEQNDFALVRFSYYWFQSLNKVLYNDVSWAIAPSELPLSQGNIIVLDIARSKTHPDSQCPLVRSIYFADFSSGKCEYRMNDRGVVGIVLDLSQVMVGGRGSASIYCPGLEESGWQYVRMGPEKAMAWKKMPQ